MQAGDGIERVYCAGRGRWPDVHVDAMTFRNHCLSVSSGRSGSELLPHAADLYLACACAAQDRHALEIFERQASEVARAAIARIHGEREFVIETLQQLWQKLLFSPKPSIAEYSGRGPL